MSGNPALPRLFIIIGKLRAYAEYVDRRTAVVQQVLRNHVIAHHDLSAIYAQCLTSVIGGLLVPAVDAYRVRLRRFRRTPLARIEVTQPNETLSITWTKQSGPLEAFLHLRI